VLLTPFSDTLAGVLERKLETYRSNGPGFYEKAIGEPKVPSPEIIRALIV
jgi:hypothetical protein